MSSGLASGVIRNLELEADKRRGVLYLHSRDTGRTVLRVCRIPQDIGEGLPSRKRNLVLELDEKSGSIVVATGEGEVVVEFTGVTTSIFRGLGSGFADITYGYHPVGIRIGGG